MYDVINRQKLAKRLSLSLHITWNESEKTFNGQFCPQLPYKPSIVHFKITEIRKFQKNEI